MQLIITLAFIAFLTFFSSSFIDWINTSAEAQSLALDYFRIRALAMPFQAMSTVLIVVIKSMRKGWLAVSLAGIGLCINFTLDTVFISNFPFSLRLGLIDSAWDNVTANLLLFLISGAIFWWLVRKEVIIDLKVEKDVAKSIFRIERWTGLESLVRNAGYIIGVIAVVNFIGSSEESAIGGYNTAIWVMWAITLIPVLAWTEATNVAVGNAYGKKDYRGMQDIQKVSILIVPYILFSIGSCLKSFFIGTGRPFWIFFTSTIVNIMIYVPLGLMVKSSMIEISYYDFLIVTNVVFVLDFIITLVLLWRYGYRMLPSLQGDAPFT